MFTATAAALALRRALEPPIDVPRVAKTVTLTSFIPEGLPDPEHFEIAEKPAPAAADLKPGEMLVVVRWMSADPYLRSGCKSEANGGPVPRAMSGFVVATVAASRRDGWAKGETIAGSLPFCTVQVVPADARGPFWRLDQHVGNDKASLGLGVLGMPGSTAYGGLLGVLRPKPRAPGAPPEVLWVSGAAGAVGSLVGQIAKNVCGCTVIGSCGGPDKVRLVTDKFGFDHAVDYKTASTADELAAKLNEVAPNGIDMYFDNVGGTHFEAAMKLLRPHGRVAICGGISKYNDGVRLPDALYPTNMIYTFQRVEGFMCAPWLSGKEGDFLNDMAAWVAEGKVRVEETVFEGVEQWPAAFRALFTGANKGKVVVKV